MAALPDFDELIKNIANDVMEKYIYKKHSLKEWIDILAARKDDGWISVNDQMPKDGVDVLFCDLDMSIKLGYHTKSMNKRHFIERGSWDIYKNVTAWRPLPNPHNWKND